MFILITALAVIMSGCVDQEFDSPPPGGIDPDIEPNLTIAQLRDMHTLGEYEEITEDLVIEAIVISSDLAGNFFRQLVIQDETGGIEIRIDMTNLDNVFPPGRKVFVKLQGLFLGDFNGLIQLGAAVVEEDGFLELARIPEVLVEDFILRGTFGHEVEPRVLTIDELTADDASTLIQLEGVQFIDADAGQTYADAVNNIAINRTVENCDKDQVLVRTSGYAAFAKDTIPDGNGILVGVLGVFGSDLQMLMRNLDDVDMDGQRCQLGGGVDLDIREVRDAFEGGQGVSPEGRISGTVISDSDNGNHHGLNLIVQDETAGIVVRFDSDHNLSPGDVVQIEISGQELSEYNGLLQVNSVPVGNMQVTGSGALPDARPATVQDVLVHGQEWESTRVMLTDVLLSGSSTFEGNVTVTDASGAMIMYTRGQASFASDALPTDTVDIVAIVSDFNAPQLVINSLDDIEGDNGGGGDKDIDEDFSGVGEDEDVDLPGWTNIAVKGERIWRGKVFDNNHYAQATAFNDASAEMESWLITPAIEQDVPKTISFLSSYGFWEHDGFTVLVSADFSGDVNEAQWEDLGARLAESSDTEHAWIESGEIDLSGFGSRVHVAFKYVGNGPAGETTSFRVDDILVKPK